jgi:hypothetical protein
MSDSLVLTGVKDVRKHTGTEMLRLNPKGGGDTFSLKRWWVAGGISTCYEPCTVFNVTTAAGTVKLALATKAEGSRVRIDHDGSFNFSFFGAGEISRACLFTDSFEVIEHYVFPSISGGQVMTVTPAGAASRPVPGPPAKTFTGVTLTGADTATDTDTESYTASKSGTATDVTYVLTSDDANDVVSTLDVEFNGTGSRILTLTGSSAEVGNSQTDTITVVVS